MSRDELHERLLDWLETSGRALELRTARLFRGTSNVVFANQSVSYVDVTSKQEREGDVHAVFRWLSPTNVVTLQLAIECKGGKDVPWVAFYDDLRLVPQQMFLWGMTAGEWSADRRDDFMDTWFESPDLAVDRVATHTVSTFGKEGNNQAANAVRQALSFARARVKSGPFHFEGDPELLPISIVLPVVVTQAPLFTCELNAGGEVLLQPVEGFDVWMWGDPGVRRRVYVRTEEGLSRFAQSLDQFVGRMHAQA